MEKTAEIEIEEEILATLTIDDAVEQIGAKRTISLVRDAMKVFPLIPYPLEELHIEIVNESNCTYIYVILNSNIRVGSLFYDNDFPNLVNDC